MATKFAIDKLPHEMKPRAMDALEHKYPNLPKIPTTSDLNASFSKTSTDDCNAVDYNTRVCPTSMRHTHEECITLSE